MSKAKRWKKSITRVRRKAFYKKLLSTGWKRITRGKVDLILPSPGVDRPPIVIRGTPRTDMRKSFTYDMPRRSFANDHRRTAKQLRMTFRQFKSGHWPETYEDYFVRITSIHSYTS